MRKILLKIRLSNFLNQQDKFSWNLMPFVQKLIMKIIGEIPYTAHGAQITPPAFFVVMLILG